MGEATMRKSCAKLGLIACLTGLVIATSAQAQLPPCWCNLPGCGGPTQQKCTDPAAATVLPNDGSPNGFSDNYSCWTEPLVWGSAQYLVGITRRSPLGVPLVTTSTNLNTSVGAIGEDGTEVLFGDRGVDLQYPQGMRFTLGLSPTRVWCVPLEATYTYMHQRTDAFSQQSDGNGNPLLARPFFSTDPNNPGEKILLVSFPGLASGSVLVNGSLQLWGLQTVGVVQTECRWGDDCCGCRFYLPIGFRYLNLNEGLNITGSSTSISPNFNLNFLGNTFGQGSQTIVTDMFKGSNEFRGAEFGVRFVAHNESLWLTLEPRISIGATEQAATIGGVSVLNDTANGGGTQTAAGGLLAVPSNSGRFARERFTYLPEGTATFSWKCFPWMGIQAGYNITYWPNVQRPGTEINPNVDPRQVPTSASFDPTVTSTRPTFFFKESTFLMQDVSIGVVFSY
jgi:Putative beta barrel porin-7 (BBP7)